MDDTILLIASGPNQHTPALQRAFDLARAAEVPVHVCLFVHDPLIEGVGKLINPDLRHLAQQQFLEAPQAWIEALVARWRADGLRATSEAVWAPQAHDAILERVLALKPALVIKDVGHEPLLRRFTYTALDWKLVRHCPAPLMLVHELSTHLPRQVLAAIDTSAADSGPLNDLILRESLKLADWTDAGVHVGHVFPYPPFSSSSYRALESAYFDTKSADREAFKAFATSHHVSPESRHWAEGNPVGRLLEMTKDQGIDLLVLGSTYRTPLDRLLIGSTAETMLFQIPCDILLVKPAEFAETLTQALHKRAA